MVKALRPITKLPLDCHMMVENPDDFIAAFAEAGADMMSVHQEVCRHLHRTLQQIAHHGMQPAVVINPATPVETLVEVLPMVHHVLVMSVNPGFGGQEFLPLALDKIAHLAELREEMGLNFRIEVDGGVAHDTVALVVEAGADMLVAGSAIFAPGKTEQNAREFLKLARAASPAQIRTGSIRIEGSLSALSARGGMGSIADEQDVPFFQLSGPARWPASPSQV